jgi:hypothetical protein
MMKAPGTSLLPSAGASDTDLGFRRMRTLFAEAKNLHPHAFRESRYILGGQPVRLRVVGRTLAGVMDLPFAHLRAPDDLTAADYLTIELWDEAETGVTCGLGSTRDDLDLHPILKHSPDRRYVSYQLQHTLIYLDQPSAHMLGCAESAAELSLYERGRPLHVPLSLWHKNRDVPLIHAGLVARNGRGVLLVGPGGSGKSTSALTSACAGFDFLSDDLVGLESLPDGTFVGHSLYSSTFMDPDHLERFPLLRGHAVPRRYWFEKKHLVLLSRIAALAFTPSSQISALVLPRVRHLAEAQLRPASKGEALMALAPSSLLVGDRSRGRESFDKQAKLVEQVPCYRLDLGGVDEVPRLLDSLLAEIVDR